MPLTFARFAGQNQIRCQRWHKDKPWDLNKWFTAITGELGEAANKLKKLNRLEDGLVGNRDTVSGDKKLLLWDIIEEIADFVTYADLAVQEAAKEAGDPSMTLEAAIISKFNEVSERNDFPERL
jgi:NTP pyrophosphatase (non-canonical NTP hydrolase)